MRARTYCDGVSRRDFLRAGAAGALSLSGYLALAQAGALRQAKAKSAIFVWLGGGPPHLDTFDPKPDAPREIRGEFTSTRTNVNGIELSEHLPRLAKGADQFALLRGVSHTLAGHELGTEYLSTGNRPIQSLTYPGYGAVVSKELTGRDDLPHFVAVPSTPQKAGYLGVRQAPLLTNSVPVAGQPFGVRGISLAEGLTVEQYEKRQKLLAQLDTAFAGEEESDGKLLEGLDRFSRQAHAMITSPRARDAFDVSRERPAAAKPFGESRFGMSCLLALRLIEAGVRFVTLTFGGWDTHANNFRQCKTSLLPQLDEGLSALLGGLSARGLLDSTLVCVTGEFGRTPQVNGRSGRDHWPRAMCVLFAGGGVKGGQVIGKTDARGMGPAGDPMTPEQVAASLYHGLGIDPKKEYQTNTGRPVRIVRDGAVIPGLFA